MCFYLKMMYITIKHKRKIIILKWTCPTYKRMHGIKKKNEDEFNI